jgi:hypothetical protein
MPLSAFKVVTGLFKPRIVVSVVQREARETSLGESGLTSARTPVRPKILFYHKHAPHYGFTNFSSHPVMFRGKQYPTSEHLFQSFKVMHSGSPLSVDLIWQAVPTTSPKPCRTYPTLFRMAERSVQRGTPIPTRGSLRLDRREHRDGSCSQIALHFAKALIFTCFLRWMRLYGTSSPSIAIYERNY